MIKIFKKVLMLFMIHQFIINIKSNASLIKSNFSLIKQFK